jgi:hypothetical protein
MIDLIAKSWGWLGVTPAKVLETNKFGNVLFADTRNRFWRICPEELSCEVIAKTPEEYAALLKDEEFLLDWKMETLAEKAEQKYGHQPEGRCFCLKLPGVLGGKYSIDNIGTISQLELIQFAGDIAEQIKDVKNGEQIKFKLAD